MKDFSHYIIKRPKRINQSTFDQIADDISLLIANSDVPVAGQHGEGDRIINNDLIEFNGLGEEACEAFQLKRKVEDSSMNAIKTMALPYDLLVQASLIVFKFYLGDKFIFTTDGEFEDWRKAIGYVRYHLDIDIPNIFPEQLSSLKVTADLIDMSQYKKDKLEEELKEILAKYTKNHDICIK